MRAVVIGYGRAGRRHCQYLRQRQISYDIVEPNNTGRLVVPAGSQLFKHTSQIDAIYDFAVICSPPQYHLAQIRHCLNYHIPVLCEKPLCGLGESATDLINEERVMLAYNYRYHPGLQAYRLDQKEPGGWHFYSHQYRPELPDWGTLLDHISHTADILFWLTGENNARINLANHFSYTGLDQWIISGKVGLKPFLIIDRVLDQPCEKSAHIISPAGVTFDVPYSETMFEMMYDDFLRCLQKRQPFPIGIREGLKVQTMLEHINAIRG